MAIPAIGAFRHRLMIQTPAPSDDGVGGQSIVWSELATVWAALGPLTSLSASGEQAFAGKVEAKTTYRVWIRYRNDLTAAMRIQYDANDYDILQIVDEGGKKQFLTLTMRNI